MRYLLLVASVLLISPCAVFAQNEVWLEVTPEASFVEPTFDEIAVGPDGLIVGRAGDRLYASPDDGTTWELLPAIAQVSNGVFNDPAIGPDGTVYIATRSRGSVVRRRIYRLLPDATTWESVSTGLPDESVRGMAASPTTGTVLVSFNNSAFYRSTDQGDSWTLVTAGLGDTVLFEHITFASDGTVYIPQQNQVFKSTDDGQTWSPVGSALPFPAVQRVGVAEDGTLYTCCIDPLHALQDGESGWQPVPLEGLPSPAENGFIVDIAVADTTPVVDFYRNGLYRLGADGTWSPMTEGLATDNVAAIAADFAGRLLASPTSGGLYRTAPDEPTWRLLPADQVPPAFPALVTTPKGNVFASAGWGGFFRTVDGETWTQLPYDPTTTGPIRSLLATNGVLLANTPSGVLRSVDDGQTWTLIDDGPEGLPPQEARHISGSAVLFAGFVFPSEIPPYALYRSADEGATWTLVPGAGGGAFDFAVGWDGTVLALAGGLPLRSTDGGLTWSESGEGIDLDIGESLDELARGRTGEFFTQPADGFPSYRTTTDGDVWTSCVSFPCGPPLLATPDMLYYAGVVFGEGYRIVRVGDDDAETPVGSLVFPFDPDPTRFPLQSATLDGEGRLYAGLTYGLYGTVGNATPLEPEDAAPRSLTFEATYPNPSRGTLTFVFSLAKPGPVTLRIYDLLGRPVAEVVDGSFVGGRHEISWQARGLSSGVYVAELLTASGVARQRFTLLR